MWPCNRFIIEKFDLIIKIRGKLIMNVDSPEGVTHKPMKIIPE
jgi:hypothetical protein